MTNVEIVAREYRDSVRACDWSDDTTCPRHELILSRLIEAVNETAEQ